MNKKKTQTLTNNIHMKTTLTKIKHITNNMKNNDKAQLAKENPLILI